MKQGYSGNNNQKNVLRVTPFAGLEARESGKGSEPNQTPAGGAGFIDETFPASCRSDHLHSFSCARLESLVLNGGKSFRSSRIPVAWLRHKRQKVSSAKLIRRADRDMSDHRR
jgi:hypothetical protein